MGLVLKNENMIRVFLILIILNNCQIKNDHTVSQNNDIRVDSLNSLEIRFEKELEIVSTDENLLQIGSFMVDTNSQIFVSNGNNIVMFNSKGEYVETLGRKGRGPGEFSNMGGLKPKIDSNKIYAYDDVLQKINVYNIKDKEFLYSISINLNNWKDVDELKGTEFSKYFVINDSLILGGFKDYAISEKSDSLFINYYYLDHKNKTLSNQIHRIPYINFYSGSGAPVPFILSNDAPFPNPSTRNYLVDLDSESNMYVVWTENFIIKIFSPQGDYLRSIYYKLDKSELIEKDILNSYESNGSRFVQRARNFDFPKTWPAIDQFFIDDEDRIWISTITNDEQNYEWFVLKKDGELIAKFKWKGERLLRNVQEREIKLVRNDHLYTLEENQETGEKRIIKYKIIFGKI